jgi:preprotein translocase subunit SecG
VLVLHVLVAVAICGLVLLQHGKGADMGAAFGSGSSGSLFGASGSANFLSRSTAVLAAVFFVSSMALTWFGTAHGPSRSPAEKSIMDAAPATKASDVPAPSSTLPPPTVPPAAPPGPAGSAPATPKSGEIPK